jgi:hypothetical protein
MERKLGNNAWGEAGFIDISTFTPIWYYRIFLVYRDVWCHVVCTTIIITICMASPAGHVILDSAPKPLRIRYCLRQQIVPIAVSEAHA